MTVSSDGSHKMIIVQNTPGSKTAGLYASDGSMYVTVLSGSGSKNIGRIANDGSMYFSVTNG